MSEILVWLGSIAFLSVLSIFFLAIYIYFSLAWMTIGKKLKYKYPQLAFVPIGRTGMILQMGNFHWALTFLYLIPILGWIALFVLTIICKWRIFEKRNYPNWLSLIILVPQVGAVAHAIIIGLVAWKDEN